MTDPPEKTEAPDAFVSHSSRDKDLFVRPLAECLAEEGATIWYDEYSMRPGDSLSTSIDEGLSLARCGVVIISPAFIRTARESGWTRYELRGLVSNSIGPHGRRIVPIWLDVTVEEVTEFSAPLADLLAIDATGKHIEQIALEVLQVVAPQHMGGLSRLRILRTTHGGREELVAPSKLTPSPTRDRRVGGHVPLRALLVTQALADCGEPIVSDLDTFLENLSRDLHHEKELRLWEAIASSYTVGCRSFKLDAERRSALYRVLLTSTFGRLDRTAAETLTAELVGPVLEHFQLCMGLARGEAVIGQGGIRGLVGEKQSDIETIRRPDEHESDPM